MIRSLFGRSTKIPGDISEWVDVTTPPHTSMVPLITWIGHSSFLIQVGGVNILTDPIFGTPSCIYPRILPPGLCLEQLPPIDYVLISHNHRDHMDAPTLAALKKHHPHMTVLVPEGDKRWFDKRGYAHTDEFMWWELHRSLKIHEAQEGMGVQFTFLPAIHWSQRGVFDQNKSLWGSWMIEWQDHTIYFAGDTAYSSHFSLIAQEFPSIDVALMPIGPCEPRPWMRLSHVNACEAGRAFLDLNARHFVPMHWGAFPFGTDTFDSPLRMLKNWWQETQPQLEGKTLQVMKVGEQRLFEKQPHVIASLVPESVHEQAL